MRPLFAAATKNNRASVLLLLLFNKPDVLQQMGPNGEW